MRGTEDWLYDRVMAGISRLESWHLAVDVGANCGLWTSALSEFFDKVLAVEPDERAYTLIEESLNVTLVKAAVSEFSGESLIHLRPSPEQNSMLLDHPIGGGGGRPAPSISSVPIRTISMDDLCAEGADFVKMDIEGAEVDALRGCVDVDRWRQTLFVVECHDTFGSVKAELERLGKSVERIPHPWVAHPGHCWAIGE